MSIKASRKLFDLSLGIAIMLHIGLILPVANFLPIQKTVEQSGHIDEFPSQVSKLASLRRYREAREEIIRFWKMGNSKTALTETQIKLSGCLIMVGEYDEAIKELSKPYFPTFALDEANRRLLLSQAYISTSKYRAAINELEFAKQLIPPRNSMRREIQFELGKAYLGANDLKSSAKAFEELRSIGGNPKCVKIYSALLDVRNERTNRLVPIVTDLLSFWRELPLEAVPNADFLANYCSEIGHSRLSKLLRTSVRNFES